MPALVWVAFLLTTAVIAVVTLRDVFGNSGRVLDPTPSRANRLAFRLGSSGIAVSASFSVVVIFWDYQTTISERLLLIFVVPWVVTPLAWLAGFSVLAVLNSLVFEPFAKWAYQISKRVKE